MLATNYVHEVLVIDTTLSHQNIPPSNQSMTHSLKDSASKNQLPVLDGVRAIACLGVLLFHVNFIAGGKGIWNSVNHIHDLPGILVYIANTISYAGNSGVILFFLLSGFLLFLPYCKALLFESRWPSLRRFYLRRIFRILPGYYTVLFLIILFFHPQYLRTSYRPYLWPFLTFTMSQGLANTLNGSFWSLSVEFQFYLLLPLFAWLFSLIVYRGTLRWRILKLTFCLLLMITWGLLTRCWGLFLANTSKLDFLIPHAVSDALIPYLYSDTGKFFEVFAVGMLVSMIYTCIQYAPSVESWHIRIHRLSPLLFTLGLTILFCLSLCYFYFIDINPSNYGGHSTSQVVFTFLDPRIPGMIYPYWEEWQTLVYAIGFGLCLLALLCGSPRLKHPFESPVLRWIASISFSLYMWHFQLMSLFANAINPYIRYQGWGPLVQYSALWCWILVIIIPSSAMLYRWIEQPGIRLGEWLIHKLEPHPCE